MTASPRLPLLTDHQARRPYGLAIQARIRLDVARIEAHEHRVRLAIWAGVLVPLAAYVIAVYGVAILDAMGLLP